MTSGHTYPTGGSKDQVAGLLLAKSTGAQVEAVYLEPRSCQNVETFGDHAAAPSRCRETMLLIVLETCSRPASKPGGSYWVRLL